MKARILGNLVLAFHFVFVLFSVLGSFLVFWKRWIAWLHVPSVLWSSFVNLVGRVCPLTPLENRFRRLAGQDGYEGGFIEHYIAPLVYPGGIFEAVEDLAGAVLDFYRSGAPFWHLGFVNPLMARAKGFAKRHILFGAYPAERAARIEPALGKAVESRQGRVLPGEEARRLWEQRFSPATTSGQIPRPGRAFVRGVRLGAVLQELTRKLRGMAIQGTVARTGEVSLLAFEPGYLSFTQDLRLMEAATRSWMPESRKGRSTGPFDEL